MRRYAFGLAVLWTVLVLCSLAWNLIELNRKTLEAARIQARTAHAKDVDYRSWNAELGGVYVPVTMQTQPNPYLEKPERDITTAAGRELTLVNPAYMTRMVHRIGHNRYGLRGHITSLKPIRPENAPDAWEANALGQFENGIKEVSSVETLHGESFMRLMRPLVTEEGCLACHRSQGYKKGDTRGGISVAVPMEPLWAASHKEIWALAIGHSVLWFFGLAGIYAGTKRLSGTFRDLELSQDVLSQSEERYRLLFENSGVLVSVYNREGVCLLMNKTVADLFGGSPSDFVGKSIRELHPEAADEYVQRIREIIDLGKPKDYEDSVSFPKGQRWLLSNVHPVRNADAEIVGAQIISQDITDLKNSEELRRTLERFQAVSDLSRGVAHNFNNLLQIVIGHLELALLDLQSGEYQEVKEALEKVLKRSKTASETVKRLQTFAGMRDEDRVTESMVFDLSQVAREAIEVSKTWWEKPGDKSGTPIAVETAIREGCLVEGDETEIFSFALGLVRNAVEAVKEAGGGKVCVDSFIQGEEAVLRVRDAGVGISAENLDRIFNPFFTTKAGLGFGLTLATGKKIIEDHGGHIRVDSMEKQGSTFTVTLPLAKAKKPTMDVAPNPKRKRTLTVLAIDDEAAIVDLIKAWMHRNGHTAFTAVSGEEGLGFFEEHPIDVVICDLGMPGMNGWEVGKKIRESCEERGREKTAFVILTGWGGQSIDPDKIAESGVDAVVEKPLKIGNLLDVIHDVVERS